jgi:hypothetical protein
MTCSFFFHDTGMPEDELFQFELRVAQRADQLAAKLGTGPERDRECWQQAEREELALALGNARSV